MDVNPFWSKRAVDEAYLQAMGPEDLPKVPGSENSKMAEIAREESNGDGGPPAGDLPGYGQEIEFRNWKVQEWRMVGIYLDLNLGFHRLEKKELEDMVGEQYSEVMAELFDMITELYGQMVEILNGKGGLGSTTR